ncbi:extensin family protein [Rhodovulum sp.]|uniref:extensin family protein n=1 Tax=Rhodovulum sp. TaxID=34009 RepID=UPI00257A8928|nr:extensin family protein [Rhodovulum sp.]
MRRLWGGALVLVLAATPALAGLETSPRPEPRPAPDQFQVARAEPASRPAELPAALRLVPPRAAEADRLSAAALARSLRPQPRPERSFQTAALSAAAIPTQPANVLTAKRGAICGDDRIRGEEIAPILSQVQGCGVDRPVRVTSVDGVRLSQTATMDCDTARALRRWVTEGAKPAIGRKGGGLAQLEVAAHYVCRTRNHQAGARISEHGRGRAVDISALTLANGSRITVLGGWRDPAQGKILRQVHKAACGPFGTVLGPESDRFHQDHFHFDTARHRNGAYCR